MPTGGRDCVVIGYQRVFFLIWRYSEILFGESLYKLQYVRLPNCYSEGAPSWLPVTPYLEGEKRCCKWRLSWVALRTTHAITGKSRLISKRLLPGSVSFEDWSWLLALGVIRGLRSYNWAGRIALHRRFSALMIGRYTHWGMIASQAYVASIKSKCGTILILAYPMDKWGARM